MGERRRMPPDVRRQQIVDTAVRLFYSVGYEGASLRDLARQVGINKATIYHYFERKEDILFQIVDEVGNNLLDGLRDVHARHADPMELLEAMIRFQIGYMEEHLEPIKVLVEEQKSLGAELAGRTKVVQGAILALYEETLTRCMDSGRVRRLHLASAAFGILGQINWLYHWYKPDGPLTTGQLADQVISVVFHGLIPHKDE